MGTSVSDILAGTLRIMKDRFWSMLGIWAVFFAITIGVGIVFALLIGGAVGLGGLATENPFAMGAGMIVGLIVFYLGYIMVICAQTAALNAMASPLQQPQFGEAFSAGWRSAPTLLGIIVVLIIAYLLGALVIGGILGALALAGQAGTVIDVILAILLIPALVWLACRLYVLFPVVAVEKVYNPITAIGRCWSLTRGHALTVFLVMLILMLGMVLAFGLLVLPVYSSFSAGAFAPSASSFGSAIFTFFGFIVLAILFALVSATVISVMHGAFSGRTVEDFSETFG